MVVSQGVGQCSPLRWGSEAGIDFQASGFNAALQVISDFHASLAGATDDQVGLAQSKAEWAEKLEAFVSEHASPVALARKGKGERAANKDYLLALDHMLQTLGKQGVSEFVCASRPRRLAQGERRYFVQAPGVLDTKGHELKVERPCVIELASGKRRFELPQVLVDGRPAPQMFCHIWHDQGPVGWPALINLYRDIGVRGALEADRLHIGWGSARSALNATGLWGVLLCVTVCMKAKRGPFGGSGFLGSLSETAQWFFKTAGPSDPIFAWFYPSLCEDLGMASDLEYGTKAHAMLVFRKAEQSPILYNVGQGTKLARWFSWSQCFRLHFREHWSTFVMIVVVLGVHKG